MEQKTINKLVDAFTKTHNVLVLGNGFDLHLGLKSSFADFFESCVLNSNKEYVGNNLLYLLLKQRFYRKINYVGFFRPVDYSSPNWMDVEGFIKKIAVEDRMLKGIYDSHLIQSNSLVKDRLQLEIDSVISKRVNKDCVYQYSTIKRILSEDLDEFEKELKSYLIKQLGNIPNYIDKQEKLISNIMASVPINRDYLLQIINFNYTSVECGQYCCGANVHGTLSTKIVVGYDSTQETINDNNIFELSKDWRKLDINFTYDFDKDGVQSIIIYGHSLGEQDYPYFFELFDMCDFFTKEADGENKNKQVDLYICYSKFGDLNKQHNEFQKLRMNVSKLLNAYERYKYPDLKRNTIVTNMKIKEQIKFVEIK